MPHREILDGVLIIVGGAFLLTPGFITDAFGLLLLIPPTRAAFAALLDAHDRCAAGRCAGRVSWSRSGRDRRPQPTAARRQPPPTAEPARPG